MGSALSLAAPTTPAGQGRPAAPSNAQKMQANAAADIPHCTRKLERFHHQR